MAKRIKHVLGSIIDETQSSFIPKRHIANNICLVLDLLDYDELIREESFKFLFCLWIIIKPSTPLNMILFYNPCMNSVLVISFAKWYRLFPKV